MECGAIGHHMGIAQWLVVEASDPEPGSATIHRPRTTGNSVWEKTKSSKPVTAKLVVVKKV